ncbi:MAG: hypothetical protein HY731_01035 [Candidatus Tectomicrobia bacterium]|nr:hypothetical protein [Candidatus Tectomicrobia bacterium]
MQGKGWPVYQKSKIILGHNPRSPVGVVTLWTRRDQVARGLNAGTFQAVGNLYSGYRGLDPLVRNVLANPQIRYLVVCGTDSTESGRALVDLIERGFKKGYDSQGKECWLVESDTEGKIDIEVEASAIEQLRKEVSLVDLRGVTDPREVRNAVEQIPQDLAPFLPEPLLFPKAEPDTEVYPSEPTAHVVRGKAITEVWVKLLNEVIRFGTREKKNRGEWKELLDLTTVLISEKPQEFVCPDWLPLRREILDQFSLAFLSAYERQVQEAIESLKQEGFGAQIVMKLPDLSTSMFDQISLKMRQGIGGSHSGGMGQRGGAPSGMGQTGMEQSRVAGRGMREGESGMRGGMGMRRYGILYLTATALSLDVFESSLPSIFALRTLQQSIAEGIGECELGDLVLMIQSAHIGDRYWDEAEKIVTDRWNEVVPDPRNVKDPLIQDPRGDFIIRVEDGRIIVDHYSPNGDHVGVFYGTTALRLYLDIARKGAVALLSHALYLGTELQKAEDALRLNIPYTQDRRLL